MEKTEQKTDLKSVRYEITERAYWLVGENANRLRMGKSEFVSLLLEECAQLIENKRKDIL
jgi:hypothetical protein